MSSKRLFVDFHIIQAVPPSCVNRDDTGRPKTAVYGGTTRARVSSQCWKHAVREMFRSEYPDQSIGNRTKHIVELVKAAISVKDSGFSEDKVEKMAVEAVANAGFKVNEKKQNTLDALFFISQAQVNALAELAVSGEKNKDAYKEALKNNPSVDIAMFGRMAANNAELNCDAAVQVAHSISTHTIQNEYDYFTAVDDCSAEDNKGAAHIDTTEFNSSTLYRYATINVSELYNSVGGDTAAAVRNFADAFIRSMPTGKQNSFANRTLPDMVYVTIRCDQPVNLSGAFENPVQKKDGYTAPSAKALEEYAVSVYENYVGLPKKSFVIGKYAIDGAEKLNLKDMLDKLFDYISNNFSEVL